MNPFKIQFYGDYKMRLLDIVSPFLTEGLELESVLDDLDVSLVLNSEMTHGYGSMTWSKISWGSYTYGRRLRYNK